MKSSDVKDRVEREIGGDWGRSNAHGVDLKTCLLHPQRCRYRDSFDQSRALDLWLVLEEDTQSHGGYEIVFDENNCQYGLAMTDQDRCRVFLGYYGTFLQTLDAM